MQLRTRRPDHKETYKKGFSEETGTIVRLAEALEKDASRLKDQYIILK